VAATEAGDRNEGAAKRKGEERGEVDKERPQGCTRAKYRGQSRDREG